MKRNNSLSVFPFLCCRMDIMTLPLFTRVEKYAILWLWDVCNIETFNIKKFAFIFFLFFFNVKKITSVLNSESDLENGLHGKHYIKLLFFFCNKDLSLVNVSFF